MKTYPIWRGSRPRARLAAFVACVTTTAVVSAGLATTAAWAEPIGAASDQSVIRDAHNVPLRERARESIDYLVTAYGVSEDEALRRLDLQSRSVGIADSVRSVVGDELHDVWLDQENGGKLTFLISENADVGTAMSRLNQSEVAIIRSRYSAADLRVAEAETRARLSEVPEARITVNKREGVVVASYNDGDNQTSSRLRSLAGESTSNGIPVLVDTTPRSEYKGEPRACKPERCDTPMRGGIRLWIKRDNGTWGLCTTGFNVRGADGWAYVLTAGHCVTVPGPGQQKMYHSGLPALHERLDGSGNPDSRYFRDEFHASDGRYDYALVPYQTSGHQWSSYWLENRAYHNRVDSTCVSSTNCTSGSYHMTGYYTHAQIQQGWVVCNSGSTTGDVYAAAVGFTSGTRCGQVQKKDLHSYDDFGIFNHGYGIKVDVCTRSGDSGGPLYSQLDSKAYGILSGGLPGSGACASGEYSVFTALSYALDKVSIDTGYHMTLITTSGG